MEDEVKNDPNSWQDEMQRWARRRQEQIDLVKQRGEPLSFFERNLYYGPKNLYSSIALDLSKRWHKGESDYRKDNTNDHENVYQRLMKHASNKDAPYDRAHADDVKRWELLKKRGY